MVVERRRPVKGKYRVSLRLSDNGRFDPPIEVAPGDLLSITTESTTACEFKCSSRINIKYIKSVGGPS